MPGMESNAAELSGEDQVTSDTSGLKIVSCLEETTAMDEDGAIYEIHEEKVLLRKERHHKMQCFWQKHPGRVK